MLKTAVETKSGDQKVANPRLTALAHWIIQHTGDGIARAEIAEGFFGIERLYRGWYVDPCPSPRSRHQRNRVCRRAQPLLTKTLARLEQRELVRLVRRKRYVKMVRLTDKGKALAIALGNGREPVDDHNPRTGGAEDTAYS